MVVPDGLDPEREVVPLDFTEDAISARAVGAIHSRFTIRHGYALHALSHLAAEVAQHQRNLKLAQAEFRTRYKDEFKNKWELDDRMLSDEDVMKLQDKLVEAETRLEILRGVAAAYESVRTAASREISRRMGEQGERYSP